VTHARSLARASAALELRRYEDALREAGLAIAANPDGAEGYCALGQALAGLNRYDEALRELQNACAKAPTWFLPHVLCSDLLRFRGRFVRAVASAEEAVRLAPYSGAAHMALAVSLQKTGHAERARSELETALRLAPENPLSHRVAGDIHLEQKSNAAAEAAYRRALALDASRADTFNNLAVALEKQGKKEEAKLAFKSAVLLDPTLRLSKVNLRRALGMGLGRIGRLGLLGLYLWVLVAAFRGLLTDTRLGYEDEVASAAAARDFVIAAVGAPLLVAAGAMMFWVIRRRRLSRLRRSDSELYALLQKLNADHKAGRL